MVGWTERGEKRGGVRVWVRVGIGEDNGGVVSTSIESVVVLVVFFFSSRRRHTRYWRDWSSDVCSSDLSYSAAEVLAYPAGGLIVDAIGPRYTYLFAGAATTAAGLLIMVLIVVAPVKQV